MKKLLLTGTVCLCALSLYAVDYPTFITSFGLAASDQDPQDDPDKDGVPNITEYLIAGMDPSFPDAEKLYTEAGDPNNGPITFTYAKRANISGVSYYMEWWTALAGQGSAFNTEVADTASEIVLTLDPSDPRFSRQIGQLQVTYTGDESTNLPTNNPVLERYGDDYLWTNNLPWGNVVNVLDYGAVADGVWNPADAATQNAATDNLAAIYAAIDDVVAGGGGTVFFPAGTYFVGDNLEVPANVILRGATPVNADAKTESFDPPSRLVFPKFFFDKTANGGNGTDRDTAFKSLMIEDYDNDGTVDFLDADNVGVIYLNVNRAPIHLSGPCSLTTAGNFSGIAGFPRGDYLAENHVVFGCRVNNSAKAQSSDLAANNIVPRDWMEPWQCAPQTLSSAIRLNGGANLAILNNRVNDLSYKNIEVWEDPNNITYFDDSFEQIGFKVALSSSDGFNQNLPPFAQYDLTLPGSATFRYAFQWGISINGLYFYAQNPNGQNGWFGNPTDTPWLFRPGVSARDNWFYSLAPQAEVSGQGALIANNVTRDKDNKVAYIALPGVGRPNYGGEVLTRGFLIGGFDVKTYENDVQVLKYNIGDPTTNPESPTRFVSNDSEGIMMDNTTTLVDGWEVINNKTTANVFVFEVPNPTDILVQRTIWDTSFNNDSQQVSAIWVRGRQTVDDTYTNVRFLDNFGIPGNMRMNDCQFDGGGNEIIGNTYQAVAGGQIIYDPDVNATIQDNDGFVITISDD